MLCAHAPAEEEAGCPHGQGTLGVGRAGVRAWNSGTVQRPSRGWRRSGAVRGFSRPWEPTVDRSVRHPVEVG